MYTIGHVAKHTGISAHTIRAWERRYSALVPKRTAGNHRLYTISDIDKLILLDHVIRSGHSIGNVANLSIGELKRLSSVATTGSLPSITQASENLSHPEPLLIKCMMAVHRMDGPALEYALTHAAAQIGVIPTIERVILPLLNEIGNDWHLGDLRLAKEHLATSVLRSFLGRTLLMFEPPELARKIVVTTPVGQTHELGALIFSVIAASDGWEPLYLGPNLPSEEIAGALHLTDSAAIALSIVFPPDDPRLDSELRTLRKAIGPAIPILVGGRSAVNYLPTLEAIDALQARDLRGMRTMLETVRREPMGNKGV